MAPTGPILPTDPADNITGTRQKRPCSFNTNVGVSACSRSAMWLPTYIPTERRATSAATTISALIEKSRAKAPLLGGMTVSSTIAMGQCVPSVHRTCKDYECFRQSFYHSSQYSVGSGSGCSEFCTGVRNPNVVRASLGTWFTVPLAEASTPATIRLGTWALPLPTNDLALERCDPCVQNPETHPLRCGVFQDIASARTGRGPLWPRVGQAGSFGASACLPGWIRVVFPLHRLSVWGPDGGVRIEPDFVEFALNRVPGCGMKPDKHGRRSSPKRYRICLKLLWWNETGQGIRFVGALVISVQEFEICRLLFVSAFAFGCIRALAKTLPQVQTRT